MVGTIEMNVASSQPQKPLPPVFAVKGSPSSLRLLDIPKAIGNWSITKVYISVLSPDNTTQEIECVRTGNVYVGTFNGTTSVGKVLKGIQILADGKDENNQNIEGYCLGIADYFVLDSTADINRLIDKITVRFLNELPTNPVAGDMMEHDGTIQLYDGTNWIDMGGGGYITETELDSTLSAYATKEYVQDNIGRVLTQEEF